MPVGSTVWKDLSEISHKFNLLCVVWYVKRSIVSYTLLSLFYCSQTWLARMMSSDDGDKPPLLSQQLYPSASFSRASPCLPVDAAAAAGGGRNPRCARCSNHGVSVPLKGHKAYCSYRRCECDKCQLVVLRRTIMAQQVAWRRRQDLDRLRRQQQQQQQMMMMSKRRKTTSYNDSSEPGIITSYTVTVVSQTSCTLTKIKPTGGQSNLA